MQGLLDAMDQPQMYAHHHPRSQHPRTDLARLLFRSHWAVLTRDEEVSLHPLRHLRLLLRAQLVANIKILLGLHQQKIQGFLYRSVRAVATINHCDFTKNEATVQEARSAASPVSNDHLCSSLAIDAAR
jgi:hypothetical protein